MNKLLTPAELADILGLAPQTIYNLRSMGASLPPCVRIGRVVRFPIDGVEAWIAAQAEQALPTSVPQAHRINRFKKAEHVTCSQQGGRNEEQ